MKFTIGKTGFFHDKEKKLSFLKFSDVELILHKGNSVKTDIDYKPTNTHDYLPHDSAHPDHTRNDVPSNLDFKNIDFVSNPEKAFIRLDESRQFL